MKLEFWLEEPTYFYSTQSLRTFMTKSLVTLCAVVALGLPTSAEAILGSGNCIERVPVKVEVQRGDTLIRLAKAYYGGDSSRYLDIARANGVKDPNKIKVGQVLELPGKTRERWRLVSAADYGVSGGYCTP